MSYDPNLAGYRMDYSGVPGTCFKFDEIAARSSHILLFRIVLHCTTSTRVNGHVADTGGGVNIARDKTAFMSSVALFTEEASRGNDGNYNTHFHTSYESSIVWWAVDLGDTRTRVTRVRITNRHGSTYGMHSAAKTEYS